MKKEKNRRNFIEIQNGVTIIRKAGKYFVDLSIDENYKLSLETDSFKNYVLNLFRDGNKIDGYEIRYSSFEHAQFLFFGNNKEAVNNIKFFKKLIKFQKEIIKKRFNKKS